MTSMIGNRGMSGSGRNSRQQGQQLAGYDVEQFQTYTPEMMDLWQQMHGNVGQNSYLGKLAAGDESTFNQMEAPAFRQFNELQGGLASRFSGMGTGGRKSSGFQNAATAATSNFAQDLASRRQSLQQQAIKDLHSMSSNLLGHNPYEQYYTEPKKNFGQQLLGGILPLAGMAGAGYMSGWNPAAMQAGYGAGDAAAQAF